MTPTEFYAYTQGAKNVLHINTNSTRKHLFFTKFLIQNSGAQIPTLYIVAWNLPAALAPSVHGPTQRLRKNHPSNTLSIKGNTLPSPKLTFPKIYDELYAPRAVLTTAAPFTEISHCSQFRFHCSSQTSATYLPSHTKRRCRASFRDKTLEITMFISFDWILQRIRANWELNLQMCYSFHIHNINTLRTGLLNCLNARSRGLIQSEVRFL